MKRVTLAFIAGSMLVASAGAVQPQPYPNVTDSSTPTAESDRVMRLSVEVPAPVEKVWERWTTAEGWRAFATPHAVVDFRVDGVIESSYGAEFTPGAPGNIKNRIVAFVPGRMLAFRNIQTPPGFVNAEAFAQTATIIEMEPAGASATRVTLTGVGFKEGKAFDELYAKFRSGNSFVLQKLRDSFVTGPVDWAAMRAQATASVRQ